MGSHRLAAVFVVAVLAASRAAASGESGNVDVPVLRARALVLMDLDEYERALVPLRQALERAPDDVELRFLCGLASYRAGHVADAAMHFERVAARTADPAPVYVFLARARYENEQYAESVAAVDRALALDAGNGRAWNLRGLALLESSGPRAAGSSFERAAALLPNDAVLRFNCGCVLLSGGDPARAGAALEHLRAAARLDPADPGAPELLAEASERAGDDEDAAAWLREATARAPDRAPLWRRLADLEERRGRLYDAVLALDACGPAATPADHLDAARLLCALDERDRARGHLCVALGQDPDGIRGPTGRAATVQLAELAEADGDLRTALQLLETLRASGAGGAPVLHRLSVVAEELGEDQASIRYFDELKTRARGDAAAAAAVTERRLTSRVAAIRDVRAGYEQAASMVERSNGRDAVALFLLARAEEARGDRAAAARACERAAELCGDELARAAMFRRQARTLRSDTRR